MKVRFKRTGVVQDVVTKVGERLLARSEGSYELVVEEPVVKEQPVVKESKAKAKKKDENTKSESSSSDSK